MSRQGGISTDWQFAAASLLALLLGVAFLAACSNGSSTPHVAATPVEGSCRAAQLALGFGEPVSEPTGQHTLSLTLTNRSTGSCSLFGYPTVNEFDAAGAVLPFVYQDHGDQVVTASAPKRVELSPGGVAFVTLNKYRCDLGDRSLVSNVQLRLPDDDTPLELFLSASRTTVSLGYCGVGDPGSVVSVSPIAPTFEATIAR